MTVIKGKRVQKKGYKKKEKRGEESAGIIEAAGWVLDSSPWSADSDFPFRHFLAHVNCLQDC